MDGFIPWLEEHDALAGWAQFLGAMLALFVTYLTAFAPHWRRNRQLKAAAQRLLLNAFEAVESYHRTSEFFLPFPLSLRAASMTMESVSSEIDRFPLHEIGNQGARSEARSLISNSMTLKGLVLFLNDYASQLDSREATEEDQEIIRQFVGDRLDLMRAILSGAELKRPEWNPDQNQASESGLSSHSASPD